MPVNFWACGETIAEGRGFPGDDMPSDKNDFEGAGAAGMLEILEREPRARRREPTGGLN